MAAIAIPAADLLHAAALREFILLAGKDGVGKTSAIISLAEFVSQLEPTATFFVIDTENKFRPTLANYGTVPPNLSYYKCDSMNEVTEAFDAIMALRKPGDWLAIESAGRIWERAQDMGYQVIVGSDKASYMEKRRGTKMAVTPQPDQLWSIIKGAHDSAFLDVIAATSDLNVILSTGVGRVKEARSNRKENPDRVDFRTETGIDLNLEGAPRLPYYVQTGALLDRVGGLVSCRIWRDNMSKLDDPAITFPVETRKAWAMNFWTETGR